MSNYSKTLGTYLSKNKYVNNQHKKVEYGLTSGAWAGDWNVPHYGTYDNLWCMINEQWTKDVQTINEWTMNELWTKDEQTMNEQW